MTSRRKGYRVLQGIAASVIMFGSAGCGATPSPSTLPTATGTAPAASPTASTAAQCTLPVTSDIYDGFHIGVPAGWDLFTLGGEIVVSKDATDTEEVIVRPALVTGGITPSGFFSESLTNLQHQLGTSGGTLTATPTPSIGGAPSASLTIRAGALQLSGEAHAVILPDQTAHGSAVVAFVAAWAPGATFAANRTLLSSIAACYGPQSGALYRVVHDQVFAYPIPPGWTVGAETQDTIDIHLGGSATVSYALTLVPSGSGVSSAPTLLRWALGKVGIVMTQTVSSARLADRTTSTGAVQSEEYVEFAGTLHGSPIHAEAQVVNVFGAGIDSGVIRIGESTPALWNPLNGALLHIMGAIQHSFTQDLQQWEHLSQQWQAFDQQVQGFDDALNGVDIVTDPNTGQTFEAPYGAYNPDGPAGPGYYDPAGNKLTIVTP